MRTFPALPRLLAAGAVVALLAACQSSFQSGNYSRQTFIEQSPWRTKVKANYAPQPATMAVLATADSFDAKVFMGMWCHDSQYLLPRFLSFSDKIPLRHLEIIALDTTRRDPAGQAAAFGVRAMPVFVFLRDGKELGRFVERPKGERMEQAVLRIVKP